MERKETWMNAAQQEQFWRICSMIDTIKSGRDFYRVMNLINCGRYSVDVINAAREFKQCFNSAPYDPDAPSAGTLVAVAAGMMERDAAADVEPQPIALAYTDDLGVARCGECGAELLCSGTGDMPDVCPECGRRLEYDSFMEPGADKYRTSNQQEAGTAAEAASEGQKTALGTPDTMAGNGCHGSGGRPAGRATGRGNQSGEAVCGNQTERKGAGQRKTAGRAVSGAPGQRKERR